MITGTAPDSSGQTGSLLGAYNTAAEVDLFLDAARAYAKEAC